MSDFDLAAAILGALWLLVLLALWLYVRELRIDLRRVQAQRPGKYRLHIWEDQ